MSPVTAETGFLVPTIYNSTAPDTAVASQAFALPYSNPQPVTFTNVTSGVYIVIVWLNTTGVPGGTVAYQYIYNPSYQNATERADEYLICGLTSGFPDGATGYTDATWVGWLVTVYRRANGGPMIDAAVQPVNGEINFSPGGGFTLVDPSNAFDDGEVVVVQFQPQITTESEMNTPNAGILWGGETDITVDTVLDNTAMGKYLIIAGANPVVNVTLPPISTVPDGTLIGFLCEGGSGTTNLAANLIPAGGDQIIWLNDFFTNSDPLSMCQSEELWMASYNGNWRVHMADGGWRHVGEFVETLGSNNQNVVQLNGAVLLRAQYPRLWRWVNKKLDGTMLITDTQWLLQNTTGGSAQFKMYPNCGRFSTGDGSTTFRVPLFVQQNDTLSPANVMAGGFRRAVPVANGAAGNLSRDKVGNFGAQIQGRIIAKSGTNNQVTVLSAGPTDRDLGPNNVTLPFSGQDINTGALNNETTPFYTTNYLFIRF